MGWTVKKLKEIYKNKWMRVTEEELVTGFGENVTYGVVYKEPYVVVIPCDGKELILVKQYRYPIDNFSWEFPMGHTEGESEYLSAEHELTEEVGLRPVDLEKIGEQFLAPGFTNQIGYVFLATKFEKAELKREPSERGMEIKRVSISEFEHMIANGEIKDCSTLSAYTLLKQSKKWPVST